MNPLLLVTVLNSQEDAWDYITNIDKCIMSLVYLVLDSGYNTRRVLLQEADKLRFDKGSPQKEQGRMKAIVKGNESICDQVRSCLDQGCSGEGAP